MKEIDRLNENFIEASPLLKKIGWSKKPLQNFFIQKKCFTTSLNISDDKDTIIYIYKLKLIEYIFNKSSKYVDLKISFNTNKTFSGFKKDFIVRFQFSNK
jgi:hypothetical protein